MNDEKSVEDIIDEVINGANEPIQNDLFDLINKTLNEAVSDRKQVTKTTPDGVEIFINGERIANKLKKEGGE